MEGQPWSGVTNCPRWTGQMAGPPTPSSKHHPAARTALLLSLSHLLPGARGSGVSDPSQPGPGPRTGGYVTLSKQSSISGPGSLNLNVEPWPPGAAGRGIHCGGQSAIRTNGDTGHYVSKHWAEDRRWLFVGFLDPQNSLNYDLGVISTVRSAQKCSHYTGLKNNFGLATS